MLDCMFTWQQSCRSHTPMIVHGAVDFRWMCYKMNTAVWTECVCGCGADRCESVITVVLRQEMYILGYSLLMNKQSSSSIFNKFPCCFPTVGWKWSSARLQKFGQIYLFSAWSLLSLNLMFAHSVSTHTVCGYSRQLRWLTEFSCKEIRVYIQCHPFCTCTFIFIYRYFKSYIVYTPSPSLLPCFVGA